MFVLATAVTSAASTSIRGEQLLVPGGGAAAAAAAVVGHARRSSAATNSAARSTFLLQPRWPLGAPAAWRPRRSRRRGAPKRPSRCSIPRSLTAIGKRLCERTHPTQTELLSGSKPKRSPVCNVEVLMGRFVSALLRAPSPRENATIGRLGGGRAGAGQHGARGRRWEAAEGAVLGGPWRRQAELRSARAFAVAAKSS